MLQKTSLQFLKNLQDNNNREWFHANKPIYQKAKLDMENLAQKIIQQFGAFEPAIANLEAKRCTFRIHRDVRFSKNKQPYKNNMGAYFCKGGKQSSNAGYYLHIEPYACFIGGGMYMPPSAVLKKVRQEIDYNTQDFINIIQNKNFIKHFVKLQGNQLKTAPKGYPRDHPYIEFLRHKDYIVSSTFREALLFEENFVDFVVEKFKAMKPFNDFLNMAIATEEAM